MNMHGVDPLGSWTGNLPFLNTAAFTDLARHVQAARNAGTSILPGERDVFNALRLTPLEIIKVVILGQDPYPNKHHAHGLAFSIPAGETRVPKSLVNILTELRDDTGIVVTGGNLEPWARQGVLLLNRVLTVEEGRPNSHGKLGWQVLTRQVIQATSKERPHVVFILWGNQAQECKAFIDAGKHHVIESPHPSPLAAYRGFFGSKPFSRANAFLSSKGIEPVDWSLG